MKLESLLQYLDGFLGVADHPDYGPALNGLQVEGTSDVQRLAAAVDASEEVIDEAVKGGADLLLVHHGLFWDGFRPLTGRRYRKVRRLVNGGTALYSVHLPLDAHAEVGNAALLAAALGVEEREPFGDYKGSAVGWGGRLPEPLSRDALRARIATVLGDVPVHVIPGGPDLVSRVAVVTGGGASFTEEAAAGGWDALVTGEGSHHTHADAMELGVTVYLGGHYATETFGVRALAEHLAERFDLEWWFIDRPTGL